jgi:nicotinate-nucleotide pyrophosphorylase
MQRIQVMFVPRKILEEKLKQLLAEDIGLGDVTSAAVVPSGNPRRVALAGLAAIASAAEE